MSILHLVIELFPFSAYSMQRQAFLYDISEKLPEIERESTIQTIKVLLNSKDFNVNEIVMMFISSCMIMHDTLLLSNEDDERFLECC